MKVLEQLRVCVDCLMFIANGEVPADRPDLADQIARHIGAKHVRHLVNADDCESGDFSWRGCECCGSQLGGTRHKAAILGRE